MSQARKEVALLEEVKCLPSSMQKVYMQLIATIDSSLQKLGEFGAKPEHISEEFIEKLVTHLLAKELSSQGLERCVEEEMHRQILIEANLTTLC